jgi:flagellar hook assembly protein FlgD
MKKSFFISLAIILGLQSVNISYARSLKLSDLITDIELEDSIFDPYEDQEAKIEWTQDQDTENTLEIYLGNNFLTTVFEDRDYSAGSHQYKWDGEDDFGDLLPEGRYTMKLTAETENRRTTEEVDVVIRKGYEDNNETVDARLKRVYLTKEEFDAGLKERNYLVFTLTAEADVQGSVLDQDDNEVYEFIDENDKTAGTYAIRLDNDELTSENGTFYKLKLTAENNNGKEEFETEFKIEREDQKLNNKPNISRDYTDGIPYNPRNNTLNFSFNVDRDSELSLEIYSGFENEYLVDSVMLNEDRESGNFSLNWDGRDQYDEVVDDGIYQYKITARNRSGRDIERGYFSVEDSASANYNFENVGGFSDVDETTRHHEAILWTKNNGIFNGYENGEFKPFAPIKRAEALATILRAFEVKLLAANGENFGFKDLRVNQWYSDIIKTGLSLGIVRGYPDSTMRPGNNVIRAEALVMTLNTARLVDSLAIPNISANANPYLDTANKPSNNWYINHAWIAKEYNLVDSDQLFRPGDLMTRGEMADMLYRYHLSGLKKN